MTRSFIAPLSTITATEVVLPGVAEPSELQVHTRDLPPLDHGQVLVTMEATGISMAEQSMRRGRYPGQPKFPFVPGYDLVGTVASVATDGDAGLVGTRVAAITKTGGWATHVILRAVDLIPVADGLDPGEVETMVVNGITAWQMLHRRAGVRQGETILVHGANGGVGTLLVQLGLHAGARVIGTAHPRHHDALRALGAVPLDYHDPDLTERIRELAPDGVDAAFDHLGGESLDRSWNVLAPGGRLVSYAIATKVLGTGSMLGPFLATVGKLLWWNLLPNGKKASFYDLWSGHLRTPRAFRSRAREDLGAVLDLLSAGILTAHVAARFPLSQASEAMQLAESHTAYGKVVLVP